MALTNDQKKQWAQLLFCKEKLTQKEIADRVGVSPVTINRWVEKHKWKAIRDSYSLTLESELSRLRAQLSNLNDLIMDREPDKRFPTSSEADTLSKLSATIKSLTTEVEINEIINVASEFINWLKQIDFEKAQEFTDLFDSFIGHKLSSRK